MAGPWRNQLAPSWDGATVLTPTGEALFQQQAQDRMSDDYDLRRAWALKGGGPFPPPPEHLEDTGGKLPNHPTFSTESPYSTAQTPGGVWAQMPGGMWTFWPSQTNADQFGIANLQDYFSRVEPNSLLMPQLQQWSQSTGNGQDAPWVQNLKRLVDPNVDPRALVQPQYQNTDPYLNRTGPRIGDVIGT